MLYIPRPVIFRLKSMNRRGLQHFTVESIEHVRVVFFSLPKGTSRQGKYLPLLLYESKFKMNSFLRFFSVY